MSHAVHGLLNRFPSHAQFGCHLAVAHSTSTGYEKDAKALEKSGLGDLE